MVAISVSSTVAKRKRLSKCRINPHMTPFASLISDQHIMPGSLQCRKSVTSYM